jgi:NTP pyrophosphatase (non-canonical NTP hydrolase)
MKLSDLQFEHEQWLRYNFPNQLPHEPLLGLVEEVGELSHAHLKYGQRIRGYDQQQYWDEATDAVGDILVYLASYCNSNGLDLQKCLEETWQRVRNRDWQVDPVRGGE